MTLQEKRLAGRINAASTRPSNGFVFVAFLSTWVPNGLVYGAGSRPAKVLISRIDYMDRDDGGGTYSRPSNKATFFVHQA
jgi:hypothetical protein